MPFDPNTPRSRDEVLLQAIVSGDSSTMGDPRDREEEFVKAIADKETLPDYSEASNGDVLQIGSDGPEWGAVPDELPAIAAGDAGKVLKVNSGENGTEWGTVPNELPTIAAGDAGKVLKVNSGENGVEWGAAGGGIKYVHNISIYKNMGTQSVPDYVYISLIIINESNSQLTTITALSSEIQRLVGTGYIAATGTRLDKSGTKPRMYSIVAISVSSSNNYYFMSQGYQITDGAFDDWNDATTHSLSSASITDAIYSI